MAGGGRSHPKENKRHQQRNLELLEAAGGRKIEEEGPHGHTRGPNEQSADEGNQAEARADQGNGAGVAEAEVGDRLHQRPDDRVTCLSKLHHHRTLWIIH